MKSSYQNVLLTVVCAALVAGGITGCASPAKSNGMIVNDIQLQKQYPQSVRISVEGGSAKDPVGFPSVSNEAFSDALAKSITESKLFSEVKKGDGGDYYLNIQIFSIEQQPIGFDLTTYMEVGWVVIDAATGKQVMQKAIKSSYTATVGKAIAAVTRIRLATEGAAKENIRQGILEIAKLEL